MDAALQPVARASGHARSSVRVAAHVVGLGLTFLVALAGAGLVFHLARGPHAHVCSPPICISQG